MNTDITQLNTALSRLNIDVFFPHEINGGKNI